LDEEDPFRRLIQKLLQSYEEFVELFQQYQECCEEVEHMPFRTQAERQKAALNLRRQRKALAQLEAVLRREFGQTNALVLREWRRQLCKDVAGLDEELRQLKHEGDSRGE
jgi:hypothetical protein